MRVLKYLLMPIVAFGQSYEHVTSDASPNSPDYHFSWRLLEENSVETVHSRVVSIRENEVEIFEIKAFTQSQNLFVWHSSGALSDYNPSEFALEPPSKVKCRYYRPDGVYRGGCGEGEGSEYTRVFSSVTDNAEIFVEAVAYDKSSYLADLRNALLVRYATYQEQSDHMTAAMYKDAAMRMLDAFKKIPHTKTAEMNLMGYEVELQLTRRGLISSLAISSEERGTLTEIVNEYNTLSKFPDVDVWDPLENLEHRRQSTDGFGLKFLKSSDGRLKLTPSEGWSEYLYDNKTFEFLDDAYVVEINGGAIDPSISIDNVTDKKFVQISFREGDTLIVRRFNRISLREIEILKILKSINFPSSRLFD